MTMFTKNSSEHLHAKKMLHKKRYTPDIFGWFL